MSLIEVMAALTVVSFGFLALAGSATTGARMLLQGRQRQAASELAERQIEHLRNLPYDEVALTTALTPSSEPTHPDYDVSSDGLSYDHDGDGTYEPLEIDSGGQLPHTESLTVGTTSITAYQYVTWVDDPTITGTEDVKRVTIVALLNDPAADRLTTVSASTLLSPGTLTFDGTSSGATQGGGGPTPTPTPSSTPGPCTETDTTPPTGSFAIASGTGAEVGYTASTTVTITLSASDPCTPITVRLSNDGTSFSGPINYDSSNPTVTWALTSGDGTKNVWVRYTDAAGNSTTLGPNSIVLDQTPPTVPGTLTRSLSCSGNQRTATLSWGTATDANLVGYRVYRSIDNAAWENVKVTSSLTATDTHLKTLDSVRFKIVAYDKAGNEGPATNVVSLSKNQCS